MFYFLFTDILFIDAFPKLMLDQIMPGSMAERHFGVNVVHSNGDVSLASFIV